MKNFYKWKRILVTWSTGFKWSWLSFWLHSLWAKVAWFALEPNTNPSLYDILDLENKIENTIWDITTIELLEKKIKKFKPEIIFHLAAQALVRESYENPVYTMSVNVMGTVNVLEMIKKYDFIKWWVLITTDKVYDNKEWLYPYREIDRLWWFDPYSSSKAMCEIAIDCYNKSFLKQLWKPIATIRAWNVIWWGDWSKDRLVPDIIRCFNKNEKIVLRNPNSIRPWQHVLECLHGYLTIWEKLFEHKKFEWIYNIWPDYSETIKVIDIVKKSINIFWKGEFIIDDSNNHHESNMLLLDNTKVKTLLWWKPKYTITQMLESTISWYKCYYKWWDIINLSKKEINNFV